jgi:para-nitrobenzyl esterase
LLFALACASAENPTPTTTSSPSQANSSEGGAVSLEGTKWQLVEFVGGDDTKLTPDDPSKYTLDFAADGNVSVRLDCNRGRGIWKVTPPSQIELGPMALTRAMCPDMTLHDQIARQWTHVRSFVVRDGHLFLSLMADGGIYEFEPAVDADEK